MLGPKLIATICAALVFAIDLPAQATEVPAEEVFEAGMEAYQRCQYGDALTLLTLAAHRGHRRAQEVAGLMNLLGASLYGSALGTDRGAAMRWFLRAANQGSELGAKLAGVQIANRPVEMEPGASILSGEVGRELR